MPLEVFTQRNFVADFFPQKLDISGKTAKLRLVSPFEGLRGNVHGSSMARWKARELLSRCERILVEIMVFERGMDHIERKFQG